MTIQKIKSGRVPGLDADNFVGDNGVIFFNESIGDLRLGDGITPGGIPLSSGGDGSGYILPTASTTIKGGVKIDGTTISISNQIISVVNGVYTTGSYSDPSWITSLDYSKISNAPTIPTNTNQLTNGAGFITSSSLSGLATESYVNTRGYITDIPEATASVRGGVKIGRGLTKNEDGTVDAFSGSYNDLTDRPTLFSGSYTDLTNKPTIPTDISQLTDAQGLLNSGGSGGEGTTYVQNPYSFSIAGDDSSLIEITNGNTVQFKGVNITVATTADGIVTFTGPAAIQGETGPAGADGADGDSAYDVAVANGFVGTEVQWLASLVGPQGEQGIQGIQGETGPQGEQGIQGIQGIQGETGLQGEQGIQGETGPAGADGIDGDSAYQIAITNGFVGSEAEWLVSLVGPKGDTGEQGIQGETGPQGVGVSTATVNESGNLVITLTDNQTVNAGSVIANTGNITFAGSVLDTTDSSGITFSVSSVFNSDLTVENDLIVVNQIRNSTGDVYATESFVQQAVNQLIGAAPEALNTLQELAAALGNDENFATTILNAVSASTNTVRYDINNQNLTEQEKQNARTNIGAVSEADLYAASIIM